MDRRPRTTSNIGGDMMNIANRIRELAIQLEKEQNMLKIAQQRLAKLKEIEQKEQGINDQKRRQLLQAINARNDVELEIFAIKDKVAACRKSINTYNQEREDLEAKLVEVKEKAKLHIETVYAPQQLKMDMYLRALEGVVHAKNEKIQKRLDRLAAIRAETEDLQSKEKAARKEAHQTRMEIAALAQARMDGADEDVSAIFSHNQKLIKEVTTLWWRSTKFPCILLVTHIPNCCCFVASRIAQEAQRGAGNQQQGERRLSSMGGETSQSSDWPKAKGM
jgi:chromosome segregation ATPase